MFTVIDGKTLAKLHDKEGNFTIYQVPEDCPPRYNAVLEHGTLVAYKKKGDIFRLADGQKLDDTSAYLKITAIEPPPPRKSKVIHLSGKMLTMFIAPEGEYPANYVETTVTCHSCDAVIPMRRAVSVLNGKPTRLQRNVPVDKTARSIPSVKGGWHCATCVAKADGLRKETLQDLQKDAVDALTEIIDETKVDPESPEVAAEPAHVAEPEPAPAEPAPAEPPVKTNLLTVLEGIVMDPSKSDEFVRGATWAVIKLMRGGN